jgi:hypothetical protein
MDEIISHMMCAIKVRNAKLRDYLKIYDAAGSTTRLRNKEICYARQKL